MLHLFIGTAIALIKAIVYFFILPYLFYFRIYDYYRSEMHYGKQEIVWRVPGVWGNYPVIGNILSCIKAKIDQQKRGLNNNPIDQIINIFGDGYKPVALLYFTGGSRSGPSTLLISDVNVVESMYTTKNKYFDKHPIIKDLTLCLFGKSILFAETSQEWRAARRTISPAFYKGKLVSLVDIARESVRYSVD